MKHYNKNSNLKKYIYTYIVGIIIGELSLLYGNIYIGTGMQMIEIMAVILIMIFGDLPIEIKNIFQILILFPILRIISFSIPQLFYDILQDTLIYGIMSVPLFLVIKNQWQSYKPGINLSILIYRSSFKRIYVYAPLIILIIYTIMIVGQYSIIPNLSPEIIYEIGDAMSIFLIIILSIALLVFDTKYWNRYTSSTLGMCYFPLLLTFVTIILYKISTII